MAQMAYYSGASVEDRITDPKQVLRIFRRRLPIFVLTMLTVFVLVALYTFKATPIYSSQASVIIDRRETNVVDLGSVLSGLPADSAIVDTEVEIIRSRSLLGKVVDKLELVNEPEFNGRLRPAGFVDQMKGKVQGWLGLSTASPSPALANLSEEEREARREERTRNSVISAVLGNVTARRIGQTYNIGISVTSEKPRLAADIANAIADQYLVEQLDAKFDATRRANSWLETRLADLREDVNLAESQVEAFRAASGLLQAGQSTLNEQKLSELSGQLIIERSQLAEAQARLASVEDLRNQGQSAEISGEALRSNVIADLRRQQAEINRERADLENRYGPLHPEMQRINFEEENISREIELEIGRLVNNLEREVSIASQKVKTLERGLNAQETTLVANNRSSVRLRELERNADANRTIYEAFLARFKETDESEGLVEPDARVLSAAVVPRTSIFPKTNLNLAIGLMLGGMLGIVAVIISEALNSQINSGDDIEGTFKVPFLGNFPRLSGAARKDPAAYLLANPMSNYAESFRNLRASIIFAEVDEATKTVAITSSQPDEGKTTITYGLGRMSSMSGSKTLIIDGDFRRKQLSETALDEGPEFGFLELLFGECNLEQAVTVEKNTGLHILPLTADRYTPRDVFGSNAFDQILADLQTVYDLIIIDTGPLLLLAETRVLTSKVDQVVVVSRWLKTNRAALKHTLSILKEFRANIAGVLINQVDMNKYHRQGYGHSGYDAYEKYYKKTT